MRIGFTNPASRWCGKQFPEVPYTKQVSSDMVCNKTVSFVIEYEALEFISVRGVFCVSKLLVEGANVLSGEVDVQGAKNSALPILAATIICGSECVLHNCPCLSDVDTSIRILRYLGCTSQRREKTLLVDTRNIDRFDIPHELMYEMRGSIVFLGAIIARMHKARLSFPGGCELGPRPIDLHLKALEQMGVSITESHGILDCVAPKRLKSAKIALSFPSVGATENIIIAASTANGTTTITNAAREPEIVDLVDFLNGCGAKIYGAGEGTVFIDGVDSLSGVQHSIIPDRIAAATLMAAAAITGSAIKLKNIIPSHLEAIMPVFEDAGCILTCTGSVLDIDAPKRLRKMKRIRTMPYPGFPTDAQAPVMAMASVANGTTMFVENIFESRYKHVDELARLGAQIHVEGKVAIVEGVRSLSGAEVSACELRGAAALIIAALAAEGVTEISGLKYLERGYDDLDVVLKSLGAKVRKV